MILRGKPLQCEGEKPRVPASNTSYYFQEFWVITPYGGLQENNHGENPNKGICTVPRPQVSSKAEVGLYQGQLNLEHIQQPQPRIHITPTRCPAFYKIPS